MTLKKNKVSVNNKSVETAGIPKDYKEGIAEFIWNSFDANASVVSILFDTNEIDSISSVTISDNGDGIPFDNIDETFGKLLDSIKKNTFQRSSYIRGKKGKGRFSFASFAGKAVWDTTYKKENNCLRYNITISRFTKDDYSTSDKVVLKENTTTGTDLILTELYNVTAFSFVSEDFKNFLSKEFGWFLFLNRKNDFKIFINSEELSYSHIIDESEETPLKINDETGHQNQFAITYIRWNVAIGDKYYFYFLNDHKREQAKKLTSFNNQSIDFHHSIYVESSFFNDFVLSEIEEESQDLFGKSGSNPVFKELIKYLYNYLSKKQKDYIRVNGAENLIRKFEQNKVLPPFRDNKYDQERKKDLIETIKEIYSIQPKIFLNLNEEQQKVSVGFLNLVLDSDERAGILQIMESVVSLTSDERKDLTSILEKTHLSRIVRTMKLIENRYTIINLLRVLVFDLKKFTTERGHLQKAIEENYWLFGEQFHLVSADKPFTKLLSNYLYVLDGEKSPIKLKGSEKNRRPDIFMCRKRTIPDSQDYNSELDENILVELKRPTVTIGKVQIRQVEDYLDFILRQQEFNSQTRTWKFFLVGNQIDDYVKKQYEAFKDKGKKFLVHSIYNYDVFVMTWDDVFRSFEIRHKHLLEKLDFNKNAIEESLQQKGIKLDVKGASKITSKVISMSGAGKNKTVTV